MPSELDLAALAAQVKHLMATEAHRWEVTHVADTLRVYVTLTPAGSDDVYCVRLDFGEALSSGPPSTTFCHPETKAERRTEDWPRGLTDYFKLPKRGEVGWICNPWTKEGRAHHSEWRSCSWNPRRAVWVVMTALQDILDKPGAYTGRAA